MSIMETTGFTEMGGVAAAYLCLRARLVSVTANSRALSALNPDFAAIAILNRPWVIATAPADDDEFDFVSRFFAPGVGIDEDPVTGSTHTILMPYWSARLGSNRLVARQISTRGGILYCELDGDRVKIAGHTVEVMAGMLDIQI